MNWRILAIVLLVLLIVENLFIGYGVHLVNEEERNTELCYFDICEEYVDALFYEGVCVCYDENDEVVLRKPLG